MKPSSSSYDLTSVRLVLMRRRPPLLLPFVCFASDFCGDGVLFSFSFFTGTTSAGTISASSSSDESQICIKRDRAGNLAIFAFLLDGFEFSGDGGSSSFESAKKMFLLNFCLKILQKNVNEKFGFLQRKSANFTVIVFSRNNFRTNTTFYKKHFAERAVLGNFVNNKNIFKRKRILPINIFCSWFFSSKKMR